MSTDPGEDVARLIAAGVKVSRLRVVQLVCSHGNRLVDVLRLDGRPVLVYRDAWLWAGYDWLAQPDPLDFDAPDPPPMHGDAEVRVIDLAQAPPEWSLAAWSGCCFGVVRSEEIHVELARGKRRVVHLPH